MAVTVPMYLRTFRLSIYRYFSFMRVCSKIVGIRVKVFAYLSSYCFVYVMNRNVIVKGL